MARMQDTLVNALRFRSPQIRERWSALLHAEPVTTPLANPNALVHLIDWTLEELFGNLKNPALRRRLARRVTAFTHTQECCRKNPLIGYFGAGKQAMHEALILIQAATPNLDPVERDASLDELNLALEHISRREIETFCGVCQYRQVAAVPAVNGTLCSIE